MATCVAGDATIFKKIASPVQAKNRTRSRAVNLRSVLSPSLPVSCQPHFDVAGSFPEKCIWLQNFPRNLKAKVLRFASSDKDSTEET